MSKIRTSITFDEVTLEWIRDNHKRVLNKATISDAVDWICQQFIQGRGLGEILADRVLDIVQKNLADSEIGKATKKLEDAANLIDKAAMDVAIPVQVRQRVIHLELALELIKMFMRGEKDFIDYNDYDGQQSLSILVQAGLLEKLSYSEYELFSPS